MRRQWARIVEHYRQYDLAKEHKENKRINRVLSRLSWFAFGCMLLILIVENIFLRSGDMQQATQPTKHPLVYVVLPLTIILIGLSIYFSDLVWKNKELCESPKYQYLLLARIVTLSAALLIPLLSFIYLFRK